MKKFTAELFVVFLIVLSTVDCQKWNSYNGRSVYPRRPTRVGANSEEINGGRSAEINHIQSRSYTTPKPSSRGGIGAWGYVSIILFVILSGIGIYYTIIFYPIVCKKQRMYHVMGHTTV